VIDAASRITLFTSTDGTSNYSYDNTDQLTAATQTFQPNETYSYDANGNRTNPGYQTSPNNRLQSDGTFTYSYDDCEMSTT
jgi:YD repeat-containing protein